MSHERIVGERHRRREIEIAECRALSQRVDRPHFVQIRSIRNHSDIGEGICPGSTDDLEYAETGASRDFVGRAHNRNP